MLTGIVAVVFGGVSNESEVSVITGTMTVNVLKSGGARILPVYIAPDGAFYCGEGLGDISVFRRGGETEFPRCAVADGGIYIFGKRRRIKQFVPVYAALNCCHGGIYEGGALGGMFAAAGIPMAGGGVFEGAAFIDKCCTKVIARGLGVKTLPYAVVHGMADIPAAIRKVGFPAIIKPATLGSSIGVEKADDEQSFRNAVTSALCYDDKALCESYLSDRREINCAACFACGKVRVSECEEAFSSGEFLSFDDKYSGGGSSVVPADIPPALSGKIRRITGSMYSRLYMRGIVRFDYLVSRGEVYLSEVNTVPGSLGWYLFAKSFSDFYPVLKAVIEQAVVDARRRASKRVLKTGILGSISLDTGKCR